MNTKRDEKPGNGLYCDECGEFVRVGETVWAFPGLALCDRCMEEMSAKQLASALEYMPVTLRRETARMYWDE